MFIHFGLNTYTGDEWGSGRADPALFNPTEFDATQWLRIFKETGFKELLLVTKHHDGFLLWPTRYSEYSVKNSPWRDGKGDVVMDVARATREAGLELGLYLSPWDRNHPTWGTRDYNNYFVATLWELIGLNDRKYGQLSMVWFDYGIDTDTTTPEQRDTYDRGDWNAQVRRYQPGALIAPDWDTAYPGNEQGVAPEPSWAVRGQHWVPFECDVTLRGYRSWFWHPWDDPKPLDELVDAYFTTVGRGCTMMLAVAPDQRGLIDSEDEARMREWRRALDKIFSTDLARNSVTAASSTRPGSVGWSAPAATDGNPESFWASEDPTASIEVTLRSPQAVNVLELAEPIQFGQRIASFRLEAWEGDAWALVARGTTVGHKRLLRFPPHTAQRWRVVIENARAAPALTQFGLYAALDWAEAWARPTPDVPTVPSTGNW